MDLIEVKKDVIHTTVGDRLAVPKQTFEWLIEQAEKVVKMECEYCSDYTKKVPEMHGKKSWFSLYEHYMEVADTHEFLSFKIKYCPMCGKNLGDGK